MKQYYILKPAVDTSETGPVFPQIEKMRTGYNYNSYNSVHELSKAVDDLPEFAPDLDYFIVNSKAKLTDLLSVSVISGGFLISPKFKNILTQFNMPLHKYYPAVISHKKKFFDYYWLHIISDLTDSVNYSLSKFFIYMNYAHNLGYTSINSKQNFLQEKEKVKKNNPGKTVTIWAEHIKLNEKFNNRFDLFEIGVFDASCYITTPLMNAISDHQITGCAIQNANNLSI